MYFRMSVSEGYVACEELVLTAVDNTPVGHYNTATRTLMSKFTVP